MSKFAVKKIEIPHAVITINELLIQGDSEYEDFKREVREQGTYGGELDKIETILLLHAQQQVRLPNSKFKELTRPGSDSIKDYEVRTPNLRLYLFKLPGAEGKIVVCGGLNDKKLQKQQIARMRTIKKEYYEEAKKKSALKK